MSFDPAHVFLVAHSEQIASVTLAGAVIGYLFVARMSAHLSVPEFVFRSFVIGFVFLGGMGTSRLFAGAPTWEAWIGISIAYLVYTIGMGVGMFVYDWQLKRAIEKELGRPLRYSPRGTLRPARKERRR